MMLERASRTFICSVLFLDIVEYSRKPVAEQVELKDRFNRLITSAIEEIPSADRIVLDTGDGVAISFLGDPEDALFVAMSLRDVFGPEPDQPPDVPARIGINLGPVRMVKDVNGQPNIIGDGINVSQRVMGFAKTGEILVSRSYYEIVSHISEGYIQLFTYEGSRTDKNVRDHEIYSVGYSNKSNVPVPFSRRPQHTAEEPPPQTDVAAAIATVSAEIRRFIPIMARWLHNCSLAYGTALFASGAFLLAALTSVMGTPPVKVASKPMPKSSVEPGGKTSSKEAPAKTGAKAAAVKTDPGPQVAVLAEPEPAPVKKRRFSFFRRKPAPEPEPVESDQAAGETADAEPVLDESGELAVLSSPVAALSPETAAPAPGEETRSSGPSKPEYVDRATVVLAIAPWGEVYVDGNPVGVSPPLNKVELVPGRRTIEIRNGSFPAFIEQIELDAGQDVKVRHKFN